MNAQLEELLIKQSEAANELINFGNSHEMAKGKGMIETIEIFYNFIKNNNFETTKL